MKQIIINEKEMPRTWQQLPKYLTAYLLDGYSIDIRLLFDVKSKNNRRTNEENSLQPRGRYLSDTRQWYGNSMAKIKQ